MRRTTRVVAVLSCATTIGAAVAAQPVSDVMEARVLVKEFFTTLKGQLESAIKAGGPAKAIQVCNVQAPAIALDMSQKSGWELARTSLRLRNPDNRPDAWETDVLNSFETRKQAGEDAQKMEFSEVVEDDGGRTFRYMKAIPTAEVCLKCHGSDVGPEVKAKLKQLYPDDQATGYALGDIRGAFTFRKKL